MAAPVLLASTPAGALSSSPPAQGWDSSKCSMPHRALHW